MKLRRIFSKNARRDIADAALYLGEASPRAAERFLVAVESTVAGLTEMPRKGVRIEHSHPALTDLRRWAVRAFPNYLVIYRERGETLEVLRLVHGARDLERLLQLEPIEFDS